MLQQEVGTGEGKLGEIRLGQLRSPGFGARSLASFRGGRVDRKDARPHPPSTIVTLRRSRAGDARKVRHAGRADRGRKSTRTRTDELLVIVDEDNDSNGKMLVIDDND